MRRPILTLLAGLLALSAAWGVLATRSMRAEDDGAPGTYVLNVETATDFDGLPLIGPPLDAADVVSVIVEQRDEPLLDLTVDDDGCTVRRSGSFFDTTVAWTVVSADGYQVAVVPARFRPEYRHPGSGFFSIVLVDDEERIASNSVLVYC